MALDEQQANKWGENMTARLQLHLRVYPHHFFLRAASFHMAISLRCMAADLPHTKGSLAAALRHLDRSVGHDQ